MKAAMHSEPVISTLINVSSTDRQDQQRRLKISHNHTRSRHDCAPEYIYMLCMSKGGTQRSAVNALNKRGFDDSRL